MASRTTFKTVTNFFASGWNAVTETVAEGAASLKAKAEEVTAYAQAILEETTLKEEDGHYVIEGPFASRFTFSWREILMIGGVVTSVIFAAAAFFAGNTLTGVVFVIYTILLCFGCYWLSEWTKNLTAEQILEKAKTGGVAAIHILKDFVEIFGNTLEAHGEEYAAQVAMLRGLHTKLNGNAEELVEVVADLDNMKETLPQMFTPVIVLMQSILSQDRALRDDIRDEVGHLRGQREDETARLAELRGQIRALAEVLDGFREEMGRLGKTRGDLDEQVGRLQTQLDRVLPHTPPPASRSSVAHAAAAGAPSAHTVTVGARG